MKKWWKRFFLALAVPCAVNPPLMVSAAGRITENVLFPFMISAVLFFVYLWLLLCPVRDRGKTGLRARIMMGGRRAVHWGLYAAAVQIFVFLRLLFRPPGFYVMIGTGLRILYMLLAAAGILLLLFKSCHAPVRLPSGL